MVFTTEHKPKDRVFYLQDNRIKVGQIEGVIIRYSSLFEVTTITYVMDDDDIIEAKQCYNTKEELIASL